MDSARQIENLIYRYAELIDAGDLAGVAALFANGEIISTEHDARFTGESEVLDLYKMSCRLYEDTGTPKTKHLTTNVIIDVKGDTAQARSYYTVVQATESLPMQPIISGRYHDTFRSRAGNWEFASREMFVDLQGDCSAHLLYELQ
ncbi:nuclear transport factor 2 family protein [Gymnodinialimonas sp.]